jgi:Mce-associated membrane protein
MAKLAGSPGQLSGCSAEQRSTADADGPTPTPDSTEHIDHHRLDPTPPHKADGRSQSGSGLRLALVIGLVFVAAAASLVAWLGWRSHQSHAAAEQHARYLQSARQAALNLTTIDWRHTDRDIGRILDGATGTFYDDFSKRAQPFIDAVTHAKSTTVGTVTEAALESQAADGAQVLVALTVHTSNAGAAEQSPRSWRMRIDLKQVGEQPKVANVEFVP